MARILPIMTVIAAVPLLAAVLDIPYTGGKIAGTTTVIIDEGSRLSPDTIRFGGQGGARIRFALQSPTLPAVCGAKPTIVAQFSGSAAAIWQTPDTSTDWNALTSMHPVRSDVPVIEGWESVGATSSHSAAGFPLFSAGQRASCSGEEYFMQPYWNRVIFMHFGSGRDFRGRFSFQVKRDTSYSPTPLLRYEILKSLTLHYVIAEGSNDVSGAPVTLRAKSLQRPYAAALPFFYDLRGVKRQGRRGDPEAVVAARIRGRTP